jgi:hypothetical protein
MVLMFLVGGGLVFAFTTESGKRLVNSIVPINRSVDAEDITTQKRDSEDDPTLTSSEQLTNMTEPTNVSQDSVQVAEVRKTPILYYADGDTFPSEAPYIFIQGKSAKTKAISITVNGSADIKPVPYGSKVEVSWITDWADRCGVGGYAGIPYIEKTPSRSDILQKKGSDSVSFYARVFNDYEKRIAINLDCVGGDGPSFSNVHVDVAIPVIEPKMILTFTKPVAGGTYTYDDTIEVVWTASTPVSSIKTNIYRASDNHELHPKATEMLGIAGNNVSGLSWKVPMGVAPGQYYIGATSINNVRINSKSATFTIKDREVKKEGQYSYADILQLMEEYPGVKTQYLIFKAYLEQSISFCNEITTYIDHKYECFLGLAQATGNPQFCFNIPADFKKILGTRNSCFYLVAQKVHDSKICENIVEDSDADIEGCKTIVNQQ